jgi:hypothetical protein
VGRGQLGRAVLPDVGLSATHYHSIRLHHALAQGGLLRSGPIHIIRTRYLDFADDPPWRAVREREVASPG